MRKVEVFAAIPLASVLLATSAQADFVNWTADQYIGSSGGTDYHVIDVYASFNQTGDRLLNVFSVTLDLNGALATTFYQANVQGVIPYSALPTPIILDAPAYAYDTFITIGALQGDLTNGTTADPSFDDPEILTFGTLTGCGWYNIPPGNLHGDAGVSLRVLVGRFSIPASDWQSGANITWTGTAGYGSDGNTEFATQSKTFYFKPPTIAPQPTPEDFNNDSKADIVWGDPVSGQAHIWQMNGLVRSADVTMAQAIPSATWSVVGSGDTNGDGKPDLILKSPANAYVVWITSNGVVSSTPTIATANPPWTCLGVGDIDGDGRADMVFRNTTTNEVRGWLLDGSLRWLTGTIGTATNLEFIALADLDGNGTKDIVWRHGLTSIVSAWLLNGITLTSATPISGTAAVPPSWSPMMTADLDGDGDDDLIWRNNGNGNINGWIMNGAAKVGGGVIAPNVPLTWLGIAGIDLDNDGDEDLVWRNTANNSINGWTMNGLTKVAGAPIANIGSATWASFVK